MKLDKKIIIDSLLGLIMGGAIVYLGYISISKELLIKILPDDSILQNVIFFTSVILGPFIAITLHELGHLVAGLIQGFKIELFVVGFFGLKRVENKIKLYTNTNIQFFGGVAATSPTKLLTDEELKKKYKFILISGPVSSLLFGILSFLILYYSDSALNPFWGLLSITSIGIFFATTLPDKSGIFFTDRKRYQRLSNKGEVGKIELAFLQIVNQSLLDDNCKNLSLDKVMLLQKDTDTIIQFWGYYFEYQYYKDNDTLSKLATVKLTLQNYKNYIPNTLWKSLEIDS